MALARAAREHGALAASSFGAGFGGSVWALVERAAAEDFATRWHQDAFVADPGTATDGALGRSAGLQARRAGKQA